MQGAAVFLGGRLGLEVKRIEAGLGGAADLLQGVFHKFRPGGLELFVDQVEAVLADLLELLRQRVHQFFRGLLQPVGYALGAFVLGLEQGLLEARAKVFVQGVDFLLERFEHRDGKFG